MNSNLKVLPIVPKFVAHIIASSETEAITAVMFEYLVITPSAKSVTASLATHTPTGLVCAKRLNPSRSIFWEAFLSRSKIKPQLEQQ